MHQIFIIFSSIGVAFFCLCLRCISCIDDLCGKDKEKDDTTGNHEMVNLGNENNIPDTIIEMTNLGNENYTPTPILEMEPPDAQEMEIEPNQRIEIPLENNDTEKISPPSYNEVIKSDSEPPTYSESCKF